MVCEDTAKSVRVACSVGFAKSIREICQQGETGIWGKCGRVRRRANHLSRGPDVRFMSGGKMA